MLAAYVCLKCDVRGRVDAPPGGEAPCWNCGEPAVITARVTPIPLIMFREREPLGF